MLQSSNHSPTEPDPNRPDQPVMATEREKFPAHCTFSQRYGYEPLAEPMRLEYLSKDLRRHVWDEIHEFLQSITHENGYLDEEECLIRRILAEIQGDCRTEIEADPCKTRDFFRSVLMEGEFNKVLDCLEVMFNECLNFSKNDVTTDTVLSLAERIAVLFEEYASAYWLDTSLHPYWFFPRASKEQGDAIQGVIEVLHHRRMNNATGHLRKAAEHMKMKQYEDSVVDSIHAVESVAGKIDPKSKKTLGKALDSLQKEGLLQDPLLKEALKKLHGYASQPGIRHGRQEGSTVNVGLDEAILMYGACASFAAYLAQKRQGKQKTMDAVGTPQADPQHAPNSYAPEGFQSVEQEAVQELPVEEEDDFPF